MNRRQFVKTSAVSAAAIAAAPLSVSAVDRPMRIRWSIGCFNRPWVSEKKGWTYDTVLDGIRDAGYKYTGLLTRMPNEPLLGSDATPEYLAELKNKIAARGLKVNMGALRIKNGAAQANQITDLRKQIDNGKVVGVEYLLTFGADKPENFENYYALMKDAAPYAEERGLKLVLKPHGGASGASEEIQRCLDKVKHPNFKIWFDAGNIIFYTGKDPVEELKPIVSHVTGFCAKDCAKKGDSVMIQFGAGKVDFVSVFGELKRAGFNGPVMVECCALGDTPEAVTENARKNREFLEKTFAMV
jgi:sugar phosphate isomerase/epimerase